MMILCKVKKLRVEAVVFLILCAALLLCLTPRTVRAQGPLTYPELITALKVKLPNRAFSTKKQLTDWLAEQIERRRMSQPLTAQIENDLKRAGAPQSLIDLVRRYSPPLRVEPGPTPAPEEPPMVDYGDLSTRAANLIKPEYTAEARAAGISGQVKLNLELDENGRVTTVTPVSTLPMGLVERAVDAARRSTFIPRKLGEKPARGKGTLTYNFSLVDIGEILSSALSFRNVGNCTRATAEYSRILSLDPKSSKAQLGLAVCSMIGKNYEQANREIDAALALDQNDPEIHFHRALIKDLRGDHAAAAAAYARMLELKPDLEGQALTECLYIGRREMAGGQARKVADGIIENCTKAMIPAASDIMTLLYYKRGIGYRLKAEYDSAIADFERVRRLDPKFLPVNAQLLNVYNDRSMEAFNKKDYRRSMADINLAIQFDPNSPTPYLNRCAIQVYGFQRYEDAISDCSTALRLGARSPNVHNHRGYAYEMTKRLDEAASEYQKALDIDPQNEIARSNLDRIRPHVPSLKKP